MAGEVAEAGTGGNSETVVNEGSLAGEVLGNTVSLCQEATLPETRAVDSTAGTWQLWRLGFDDGVW